MGHTCQAIVFRCMDFRINSGAFEELLVKKDICQAGQFDLVSLAGAAKALLSEARDFLLDQVATSQKLHGITKIILVMHDNCGAYGIADPKQEAETQSRDLEKITRLLAKKFPTLKVEKFILKGTATGEFSLIRV